MSSSVTATFVFTDLVDSTATAARLGPSAAEELRQTHFRLLRGAVAASGGTEVKNLGDGLMVMFPSPSRALACAVGMQQAIEHHNRSAEQRLGVRIGMSVGEAVEEDGDYFGEPVVEAARLCAAARGGQVLAADLVRLMVGRHATQTFVDVGPLALKGLPDPIDAVEVLWEPAEAAGSVPLPGRLVGAASDALFGFFGRASELEALTDACKRAHGSRRCEVVFVSGEAGIGKTSLVAQAARQAHADGTVVLFGHADEDLGVAYQPWIEALGALVRDSRADIVGELRVAQRAALARLIPDVGHGDDEVSRVGDPDTERLLLLESVVELLAVASRREPMIMVLDDVHWMDSASIHLLRRVIASSTAMEVTLVCTYRDTDLGRGDALTKLLADMHRESNVTRIALAGLDDNDLVDLIGAAAGHDLDEPGIGLAHALRRETEGNPFFTGELLRHLGESGGIVLGEDGQWGLSGELEELGLPSSIRDVVGRRVERLGADAVRLLSLAAVIGREFDLSMLDRLVDVDEDRLLDLMDASVAAALLVESDVAYRYRFAHALIQHTLYDELSATRRQRAHQRIAETLEARAATSNPANLAELATHWIAATRPADLVKALLYARRAGDAARDALAPEDAVRWYRQALELVDRMASPDEHQSAEILAELGAVQRQAAHPEYRDTLFQALAIAQRLDDTDLLVRAILVLNRSPLGGLIGDDEAKPIISVALDRVSGDATPGRARLLAELANAHDAGSEWQTRRELAFEALDVARRTSDDVTFLDVVITLHHTLATPDRLDQHLQDLDVAVATADRIGDPIRSTRIRTAIMWARYQQADIAGAATVLDEMESLAEAVGLPYLQFHLMQFRTTHLLLTGRADEAEAANERLLEFGTMANHPEALATFGGCLYSIRLHQGRVDEIADFLIDAARDNPSIAALRSTVPRVLCEMGRLDEAREYLTAEAAAGFSFPYDTLWLSAMANMTDAAATTGDTAAAQSLVERLKPFAPQVICPIVLVFGATARPLARAATLLGDYDQAEHWFATAHDVHARLHAPYWTACGQLDHADLCRARHGDGDIERARGLAATAAAAAIDYGCGGLADRAAALLAEL